MTGSERLWVCSAAGPMPIRSGIRTLWSGPTHRECRDAHVTGRLLWGSTPPPVPMPDGHHVYTSAAELLVWMDICVCIVSD